MGVRHKPGWFRAGSIPGPEAGGADTSSGEPVTLLADTTTYVQDIYMSTHALCLCGSQYVPTPHEETTVVLEVRCAFA